MTAIHPIARSVSRAGALVLALGLCLSLPLASAQPAAPVSQVRPVEIDGIAAVVNAEAITRAELAARIDAIRAQLRARRVELPPIEVLAAQVLERMILDRAQVQRARELGIRVDEGQVDRYFAAMAAERKLDVEALRRRIEADGVSSSQFREQIRMELVQSRLREREVDARVRISESEIDAFISERERLQSQGPVQLNLAQILVRVAEGASAEEIQRRRARAEEVLTLVRRPGADFAALAAAYSDAGDAMTGGSLGWRTTDRLPQLFVDAVKDQAVGGAVLARSPNGFHVLKVVGRRAEQGGGPDLSSPVAQTRARHILVRIGGEVGEAQARRRIDQVRDLISAGRLNFDGAAKTYSEDGTAARGGDLGWVLPGDTVPEFERALNALQPGQLSLPVRTPFGFHLVEVMERRVAVAPPDRVRALARQSLREQRIDEAWQDWLRQLRDRTYVEIRLDER